MQVELSLRGKHALVCGASAGIGRATALTLASLGARVTALARRADVLERLLPELKAAGAPEATALACDLEDVEGTTLAVRAHVQGRGPIHVLINNASGPAGGALLEAAAHDFERAMRRLLLSPHELVKVVLPGMRASGYGRIINVVSTSVREPIANLGVSNTIRAATAGWAKTLSRELPPGVTVNNVLPGFTDTDRLAALREATAKRTGTSDEAVLAQWLAAVPEGRLGTPGELASVIAFLASPAASFVRGTSIPVDGGRLASI